ncbi:hypothetical protein J4208_05105 [Candidatus Woesearchaeota archaeon]|nr:hypothetical protein [Candidatus Woesearchaeota archaeon]
MTPITTKRVLLSTTVLAASLSLTSYMPNPQPGAYQAALPISNLEATVVPQTSSQSPSPDAALLLLCGLGLAGLSIFYRRKLY